MSERSGIEQAGVAANALADFFVHLGLTCTVNLQGAGTSTIEDQKVACGQLKGEWKEDKCVVEGLEL